MPQASERSMALARRAVAHMKARSTDQAPSTMALPVEAYLDPGRFRHEVDRIFRRLPLALALSLELPSPRSYRAMTVMGSPIILVRGGDGVARAFVNACRHRGAPVCAEGAGRVERFNCPYHAWSYDDRGELVAMYGQSTFGDVDRRALALTELPSAERVGLIWVALTPGATFDVDEWLGGFAQELETLHLERWHVHEQREIEGPGWKVTWDGYMEAYHHNTLHANTVGKHTIGNLMLQDTYGPHQRIVFGRRSLKELAETPETEWEPEKHIRLIHSGFPNLSISGVLGDHCLVSQVFPCDAPDRTVTRQTVLVAKEPKTAAERGATEAFSAMVLQAVRDEDYDIGFKIQRGLAAGGNREFVFGRNEPALQHYHAWVARLSGEAA